MVRVPSNVELVRVRDARDMGARAADMIAALLARKCDASLTFPTGRTPLPLYDELAHRTSNEGLDLTDAVVFSLDEYLGVSSEREEATVSQFMRHVLDRVDIGCVFALDGATGDPAGECAGYDSMIRQVGIDLAVVGIGRNGHVAFNEPGSPFDSRTRPVMLTEATRADQVHVFGELARVPREALTVGLGTLMEAKEVLLLASGAAKAGILSCALTGPPSEEIPASVLQRHPRVTVIADDGAAAEL